MNKEKFLKELEKKLSVLNEKERKDIIDEYKSTIEEKIKNGEEEEKAVNDFGNIDELSKEILEAYKIDPKYKENDFKKFIDDSENIIKQCADKMAKGTKELIDNFKNNNDEINLSLAFEIIIKVFLTILFIGLLKLPFLLFKEIGNFFFSALFSPLDIIIKVLWLIFLGVIYFIVVIIIISKIFKQYFVKKDPKNKELKINNEKKTIKRNNKKEVNKESQISNQLVSIIITLIKVFVVIFILIPLICSNIGLISITTVSIYYWLKGINLLGLTLLLTGLSMISIWLTHLIRNILENKIVKPYLLITGIILTIVGGILFASMLKNINYIDEMPRENEYEIMTNTYTIDKKTYINTHNEHYVEKKVDETLEDNTFKIQVKYNGKLFNVKINQTDNYTFDEEDCIEDNLCGTYNYFSVTYSSNGVENVKSAYKLFIENLKQNKVYNYDKVYSPIIEISANEKTMSLIEID